MRGKLKQELERKRKTQQSAWALEYETCMLEKEVRYRRKMGTLKRETKISKSSGTEKGEIEKESKKNKKKKKKK